MTGALPLVARPLVGESLTSFIFRLADRNAVPVRRTLQLVSRTRRPVGWSDTNWENLARLIYTTAAELEPLRRRNAHLVRCPSAVMFLGQPLKMNFLVRDRLRICPLCVSQLGALREAWSLLHAPVCLDHEVELIDTCSCGRLLSPKGGGRSGRAFGCVCGAMFVDLEAKGASPAALDAARWLGFKINPALLTTKPISPDGALTGPFAQMPMADVISVIDLVGLAATTPAEVDEPAAQVSGYLNGDTRTRQSVEVALRSVEAAMPILRAWPTPYKSLLRSIAGRNREAPAPHHLFATRIGRMVRHPYRGLDGEPIACLLEAVRNVIKDDLGIKLRNRSYTVSSPTARAVRREANRSAAARHLGVDDAEPVFQRVYHAALRSFDCKDVPAGKSIPKLLIDEVERRWLEAQAMMSATEALLLLDHPEHSHAIAPWIHVDLLTPAAEAAEIHLCRRYPSFHTKDVLAMRRRIAARARAFPPHQVPPSYRRYGSMTSRICCGGYSKQALILDIVSGRIPTARTEAEPHLCDIYIDEAHARNCSIGARVGLMIEKDPFYIPNRLLKLLAEFWPKQFNFEPGMSWRDLRREGALRYREVRNTTGGRDRPAYHYSLVDCLERQALLSGASVSSAADALIAQHRRSRGPDERPRLILAYQKAA
jgi:hypothetical protein